MYPPSSFSLKDSSIQIPSRGLGTFQVDPKVCPEGSIKASVLKALEVGYRHFDAALAYGWGEVERGIGEAVKESGITRSKLFLVTKLHNCFHKPEDVEAGIDLSLKDLGMEYDFGTQRRPDGKASATVPLIFVYTSADMPQKPVLDMPLTRSYDTTWVAMEKLVDAGKTKVIGVSNCSSPKLRRLLSVARIHPVVNQVEVYPYFPQGRLLDFCREHEIHVTAYGPLGWTPVPVLIGRKGTGSLEDPSISSIAKKFTKTPAQLILCFMINRGVSVIPKSNSPDHIAINFDCMLDLADSDFKVIDSVLGSLSETGVRNFETGEYLGFDNFNEDLEEP